MCVPVEHTLHICQINTDPTLAGAELWFRAATGFRCWLMLLTTPLTREPPTFSPLMRFQSHLLTWVVTKYHLLGPVCAADLGG